MRDIKDSKTKIMKVKSTGREAPNAKLNRNTQLELPGWKGQTFSSAELPNLQAKCTDQRSPYAEEYQHKLIPVYNATKINVQDPEVRCFMIKVKILGFNFGQKCQETAYLKSSETFTRLSLTNLA